MRQYKNSRQQAFRKVAEGVRSEERFTFKTLILIVLLAVVCAGLSIIGHNGLKVVSVPGEGVFPDRLGLFIVIILAFAVHRTRRFGKLLERVFTRGELAIAYSATAMMYMLAGLNFIYPLLGAAGYLPYFAQLRPQIVPINLLSPLLLPQGDEVIMNFLMGGTSVPWGAWVGPLFFWFLLYAPMFFLLYAMACLFYNPWSHVERLQFPLVQPVTVTMELVEGIKSDSPYSVKNLPFAVGLAIPFALGILAIGHDFYPGIPRIRTDWEIGRYFSGHLGDILAIWPGKWFRIWPSVVGIGYFVPTDFAFSVWFFYYVYQTIAAVTMEVIGLPIYQQYYITEDFNMQFRGACVSLLFLLVWFSRSNIKKYVRAAFTAEKTDTDTMPMPPKVFVWGSITSVVLLFVAGKALLSISPLWMFMHLLLFLALSVTYARLQIEAGFPIQGSWVYSTRVFSRWFGTKAFSQGTFYGLQFLCFDSSYGITSTMGRVLESMKFAEWAKMDKRKMLISMGVALVAIYVVSSAVFLKASYSHGAGISMAGGQIYGSGYVHDVLIQEQERDPDITHTMNFLIGIVAALCFGLLRASYIWWPFHPLGFAIGLQLDAAFRIPGSFFVAWLCKVGILRYGGSSLYKKLSPLFVGLIISTAIMELLRVLTQFLQLKFF